MRNGIMLNKTASSNSRDFKEKKFKSRKALLTWDDSDESDKEISDDDDVAQLCFMAKDDNSKLKGIFKQNNKNGDGLLSKEELKEAFKNLGALFPGWRASRGLHYADANGDGYISEEELNALVQYAARVALSLKSDALIKACVSPIISIGFLENKPRLPAHSAAQVRAKLYYTLLALTLRSSFEDDVNSGKLR
ncbi:hypothetical protein RJ640_018299 [Escallonia rubra]|uniref:EF-hand domain-containing protein n=1 Tax=Escallonia rubra TaxID=112253 RepID=A0AA88SJF7_9ASTE|nr:hypothetical protein RJ640_018299 [Escallonia rubra]